MVSRGALFLHAGASSSSSEMTSMIRSSISQVENVVGFFTVFGIHVRETEAKARIRITEPKLHYFLKSAQSPRAGVKSPASLHLSRRRIDSQCYSQKDCPSPCRPQTPPIPQSPPSPTGDLTVPSSSALPFRPQQSLGCHHA